MKFALVCSLFVAFVVGFSSADGYPEKNLINVLGGVHNVNTHAAGFAPGHEGHIHSPSNHKAGCGASTTTAATTAAG